MKTKPSKCRSLAMKRMPLVNAQRKTTRSYVPYDPKLESKLQGKRCHTFIKLLWGSSFLQGSQIGLTGKIEDPGLAITSFTSVHVKQRCRGKEATQNNLQIQDHTMKTFFKIVTSNIAELHPPPHPLTLTAHPTPDKVVPQLFFIKMAAKDVREIT